MAIFEGKQPRRTQLEAHRTLFLLGVMIFIGVLLCINLVSGETLIEKYIDAPDSSGNVYGADRMAAQNFTLGVTGVDDNYLLRKIEFLTIKTGTPSLLQISIVALNGSGIPNITAVGNFLTYNTVTDGDVGAGLQDVNISVAAFLTASSRYGIVWNSTASGVADYWSIRGKNANAYEGGNWLEFISPTWTTYAAKDFMFALWGDSEYVYPNLISPTNNASYVPNTNINFSANYSVVGYTLVNSSFHVWNVSNDITHKLTITSEANTSVVINNISTVGTYHWNVEACGDDAGTISCEFSGTNRTLTIFSWNENSQTYNSTTAETSIETFIINISYDSTIFSGVSANLNYNGTQYIGTKTTNGETLFTKTLTIPQISGSALVKNLYWELIFINTTGSFNYNSTKKTQTVNPILFTSCNNTYSTVFVNFTIYNESSRTSINTTIDATFMYYLGDSTIIKNFSINSQVNSTIKLCTNTNTTYTVSSIIHLTNSSFDERVYYFNKDAYTNTTSERRLFMLDRDLGRGVIVQVRDAGLNPVSDYYVDVERYYPGTNDYEIIERAKTDIYGQFMARLIEPNTIKYRFTFKNSDNVVKKETGDMTIACRATICVLPFIIEDTTDDFERLGNLTDYDWSFSFDSTTNIFTFTWNDISGVSATNWLKIDRYLWNGTTTVCNTTSTAASGSLTCDVGSQSASYVGQVWRRTSSTGTWKRVADLSIKVGTEYETFGTEGLLWAFILLMTMISVGYYYPPVGIGLFLFGILGLWVTHIVYINPAIFISFLVIGIFFIWAFKKR